MQTSRNSEMSGRNSNMANVSEPAGAQRARQEDRSSTTARDSTGAGNMYSDEDDDDAYMNAIDVFEQQQPWQSPSQAPAAAAPSVDPSATKEQHGNADCLPGTLMPCSWPYSRAVPCTGLN